MPEEKQTKKQEQSISLLQTKVTPRGKVVIFGKWCKGCGLCVEFCPTGVLAFGNGDDHPVVVQSEKCTACHWCEIHCPDLAIIVKPLE